VTRVTRWWGLGRLRRPKLSIFRTSRRLRRRLVRKRKVLGGPQALQTSRLAGDRVTRVSEGEDLWRPAFEKGQGRKLNPTHRQHKGFIVIGKIRLSSLTCACYFWNAASNATELGGKSFFLTNAHASAAPNSRSMPLSSHSTESGPA
jgi:hypothetical protein